ncbi:MAG: hypothetical protein HKN28_01085, partial [Alphaproteobacteria bacterium]|nr:hypothetical protein [Alphaproteobacteria bacterium]
MSMPATVQETESIESSGYPLAFKYRQGGARPALVTQENAREVIVTEARQLARYGKEGIIHEGEHGSVWRLTTDEGKHLGGDDIAPFPLGFYNAGLVGDLYNRLLAIARARGIVIEKLDVDLNNAYWMTGSFVRGDAVGNAEPTTIDVRIDSSAGAGDIRRLVADAIKASPAIDGLRRALKNTFAIYVNGRRRDVATMTPSTSADAADPYRTYGQPPVPLSGADDLDGIIWKTGEIREGEVKKAPTGTKGKIIRNIIGHGTLLDPAGITETDSTLEMPGVSHFRLKSDERSDAEQAPSGLGLASAGIVFCYMTQLARYIEHQKFNIRGVRLVQYTPYTLTGSIADGTWQGTQEPVDTHLFLSGDESDETHERLMNIGAAMCY